MSWFLDQIPFLHGGLLRGPESGLKTAYFVQYLDSRRLILHFYIFTFLHFYMGVCSGVQNLGLGRFSPISGLETANFTSYIFTFLHGGLLRGPESGLETAYFLQYLDSRRLN